MSDDDGGGRTEIRELEFEACGLSKPERPEYQRLFDEYVLATIHVHLNGEELTHKNKLPSRFDLSDTVTAFHEGIESLFETAHDDGYYFCCACGIRGCAYIDWELALANDRIYIDMEDGLGDPIGDHQYVVETTEFLTAVADLTGTLTEFMRATDYREVSRGTVAEFERKREDLYELP
ncbi:hypothetical protein NGM10_12530 [Halorussus salilacus]|uniref:hypothetical protein n=1 Tax=Halorussus salilacus TaxID=2953750 RepID=UPI00209DCE7A|nr:hypothetical protein [Halorussus salilacus]USZ67549.1 hypothetical protein NGM10_12530 [Halorussus salilacus]